MENPSQKNMRILYSVIFCLFCYFWYIGSPLGVETYGSMEKKPRILCLHGHGSSAKRLERQIKEKWPESVLEKLDLFFLDAPFPIQVEGRDPPNYEWFHADQNYKNITRFDESIGFLEDNMIKHGPFDGILGFSQGALMSASMPGIQSHDAALTKVPKIKHVIVISGAKLGGQKFGLPALAADAFSSPIDLPSLHIIGGKTDIAEPEAIALLDSFVDPILIYHNQGHSIPRLDEKDLNTMLDFIDKISKLSQHEENWENPSSPSNALNYLCLSLSQ